MFESACVAAFLLITLAPALYGLHMYVLMALCAARRARVRREQERIIAAYAAGRDEADWPVVTTQIPVFNEVAVVERVITAVAALDYPRGRHEIQVLDDSTDETRVVVDRVCARLAAQGCDIHVIRRPERRHYKAGALANGLRTARGEFVAIFDADFVPQPGFLRRLIPLIDSDPRNGCVQGRWAHLNAHESWVTDALGLGIDGHFGVEQGGRGWNGLLLNFNGTAGIWRRAAIDDPQVGGWSGDTITEDLDLSYRAQLAGWRIVYCPDEAVPAELPGDVDALKAQQRRWATGSIQTARKLLPRVWRSTLTPLQKLEATFHLTQYGVNLFLLLMAMFARPLLGFVDPQQFGALLGIGSAVVMFAAAGPTLAYLYASFTLNGRLPGPLRLARLIALGLGLSVNNSLAVLVGLRQRGGEFVRTPKTGSGGPAGARPGAYEALRSRGWLLELPVGVFCLVQWVVFLPADGYVGGTFLLLFAIGLLALGWKSMRAQVVATATRTTAPDALAAPTVEPR